jgi:hypothetical protein
MAAVEALLQEVVLHLDAQVASVASDAFSFSPRPAVLIELRVTELQDDAVGLTVVPAAGRWTRRALCGGRIQRMSSGTACQCREPAAPSVPANRIGPDDDRSTVGAAGLRRDSPAADQGHGNQGGPGIRCLSNALLAEVGRTAISAASYACQLDERPERITSSRPWTLDTGAGRLACDLRLSYETMNVADAWLECKGIWP